MRVGFAPISGAVGAHNAGATLDLGVFVGGGLVSVVEWSTWDLEARPAGLVPSTLVGLAARLRWPGRRVSAEVYAEACAPMTEWVCEPRLGAPPRREPTATRSLIASHFRPGKAA
ncbi:hypothetical protein LBMAG42_55710 [Deltaproteobacteria bacterium]|nr:hypothetical protein LBMAG42_55710 [Deltaproteobacteria bacterium]